jgi:hypothetical protein
MYNYKNLKYFKNNIQFGGSCIGGGGSCGGSMEQASGSSMSSAPSVAGEHIYQTEIIDPSIKRIITLSDIHADIHSFIISLRDCAQVIRKKPGFAFDQNIIDNDVETLLMKDLNDATSESEYVEDLNYEWIDNNTYVVIIGDILDGVRPKGYSSNKTWYVNYPQLEIKLLLFINKLDDLARTKNSRVIKLLGNHEFMNMSTNQGVWLNRTEYNFPEDEDLLKIYYKDTNRAIIFMPYQKGYKILMKNGNGVLIKINNNIFVHGSLEIGKNLRYYDNINKILNSSTTSKDLLIDTIDKYTGFDGIGSDSMVWSKRYGKIEDINQRIIQNSEKLKYCADIEENLKLLTGLSNITNLRVFVGHCIQSFSIYKNIQNTTFTKFNNVPANPFIEIIEPPARSGLSDPDTNFLFGITMECEKTPELNNHYVYHVDIGSSRAFDNDFYLSLNNKRDEKLYLLSRSPQVMEIYNNDTNIRIIRSTIKNTRIHLPRTTYEAYASTIPDINLATYNKYLKYKNKYLQLKNSII